MSEGGSSSDRSGAGDIWEQSSGLRWQLVQEQEERIPGRSRSSSRRDGPVDPGLSIQGFLDCFTEEESAAQEGSSIVYHSDGNMLARIDIDLNAFVEPQPSVEPRRKKKKRKTAPPNEESEPTASTSADAGNEYLGAAQEGSDNTSTVSEHQPRSKSNKRRLRSYWQRKNYWHRRKRQTKKVNDSVKEKKYEPASVESSPGRHSPSPERLHWILTNRRLHLQPLSPEYIPPSSDHEAEEREPSGSHAKRATGHTVNIYATPLLGARIGSPPYANEGTNVVEVVKAVVSDLISAVVLTVGEVNNEEDLGEAGMFINPFHQSDDEEDEDEQVDEDELEDLQTDS